MTRTVGRHAVHNQHFHAAWQRIGRENRLQATLNESCLISHRYNNRDLRRRLNVNHGRKRYNGIAYILKIMAALRKKWTFLFVRTRSTSAARAIALRFDWYLLLSR